MNLVRNIKALPRTTQKSQRIPRVLVWMTKNYKAFIKNIVRTISNVPRIQMNDNGSTMIAARTEQDNDSGARNMKSACYQKKCDFQINNLAFAWYIRGSFQCSFISLLYRLSRIMDPALLRLQLAQNY